MRTLLRTFGLVAIAAITAVAVLIVWVGSRGISARATPGILETTAARAIRHLVIPRSARDRQNPVPTSPEALEEALEHYADHCASCHGNNGGGDTEMGRGLYPKPPDMRLAPTQALTDGELFYIIENGVRWTGMPGWSTGTQEGELASWRLVHFVRQLPTLTPAQLDKMKESTPRSPAEIRQEIEEEKFLQGGN